MPCCTSSFVIAVGVPFDDRAVCPLGRARALVRHVNDVCYSTAVLGCAWLSVVAMHRFWVSTPQR